MSRLLSPDDIAPHAARIHAMLDALNRTILGQEELVRSVVLAC